MLAHSGISGNSENGLEGSPYLTLQMRKTVDVADKPQVARLRQHITIVSNDLAQVHLRSTVPSRPDELVHQPHGSRSDHPWHGDETDEPAEDDPERWQHSRRDRLKCAGTVIHC